MNVINLTSLKSQKYWNFENLTDSNILDFKLMNYQTDKGTKENVAILTQDSGILFKNHFKVQIQDFSKLKSMNVKFSTFAISKDLLYMVLCSTSPASESENGHNFGFSLFCLNKHDKTYTLIDHLTLDSQKPAFKTEKLRSRVNFKAHTGSNSVQNNQDNHIQKQQDQIQAVDFVSKCDNVYLIQAKTSNSCMLISLVIRDNKIWNFCQNLDLASPGANNQILKYGDVLYSFVDDGKKLLKMKIRKEKI